MENRVLSRVTKKNRKSGDEENNRKRDHFIFFLCILSAALFWALIKLSGDYTVNYLMQIDLHNAPKNKIVTSLQDSSLNVGFKSNGYNILNLMLTGKLKTLYINLAQCQVHHLKNGLYRISSNTLKGDVANDLGVSETSITFSKSDILFHLQDLEEKTITVSPMLKLTFKSQHALYAATTIPRHIHIYGPRNLIDSISTLNTATISVDDLSSNLVIKSHIVNPFPDQIRISLKTVKVKLEVEKFTESSLEIPIDVSDIRTNIRTFPGSTKIFFNVFLKDYNKIHVNQFKIVPDTKNINLNKVKKLGLKIVEKPAEINNVRIDPTEVEFIIVNE